MGFKKKDEAYKIPFSKRLITLKYEYPLYLFLVPAIISYIVFAYLPMFSNVIAFMDYSPVNGWMGLGSPFVGLKHFKTILSDPKMYVLLGRTVFYSAVILIVTFPANIIFALLLNEVLNKKYKKIIQTISYMPHFVSWVIVASLVYMFLTYDSEGILNNIRSLFGLERIIFMKDPNNFPIVIALSSLFKGLGWGSIIYLAAISSVDAQLYEAAKIDGASRFNQVINVTLPSILPTISIMLIMQMGTLFSGNFEQVFNLQNPVIQMDTNTIATYTYFTGIVHQKYSIAGAVALFQGLINCVLLLGTDKISKKLTSYGLF